GGGGVSGRVVRDGAADGNRAVPRHAALRLAAGGLAAAGDGGDGVAGVVGRARRAVGDVGGRAEPHPPRVRPRPLQGRVTDGGQARGAGRTRDDRVGNRRRANRHPHAGRRAREGLGRREIDAGGDLAVDYVLAPHLILHGERVGGNV